MLPLLSYSAIVLCINSTGSENLTYYLRQVNYLIILTYCIFLQAQGSMSILHKKGGGDMFKILFVDDIQMNLAICKKYLEKYGYKVYTATDGLESIELAKEVIPDLIIMDLHMRNASGLEAVEQIRSYKDTNHIPIIACSAYITMHKNELDLFSDSISKPVKARHLRNKVENWLFAVASTPK